MEFEIGGQYQLIKPQEEDGFAFARFGLSTKP